METSAPSLGKIFSMVLFALSCVGLLIFLWVEFGGTIPFNAQGYRIEASFPYAQELATPADVRVAGVSVGKVVSTSLDPKGNRTIATIQLNNQYAPVRRDATAILRTKTLYLNLGFFLVRTFVYFVVWLVFSLVLLRWSAGLTNSPAEPAEGVVLCAFTPGATVEAPLESATRRARGRHSRLESPRRTP